VRPHAIESEATAARPIEVEGQMGSRNGGVGVIGVIVIVLVVLFLVGVIKL
jgi:hypothetical protein